MSFKFNGLAEIVAFVLLPFIVWSVVTNQIKLKYKIVFLGLYVTLILFCGSQKENYYYLFFVASIAMAYYLIIGFSVYALPVYFGKYFNSPIYFLVFIAFCIFFVVLPGMVVPQIAGATFLAVGWDLVLSSYSYIADIIRMKKNPKLARCFFFLFINPTLVYSARGQRVSNPCVSFRAIGRFFLGVVSMYVSFIFSYLSILMSGAINISNEYLSILFQGLISFFTIYLAHSGLASMKIGLMRMLGYTIPERYIYPFLSRNPLDFWRRWNIYISIWCRKYLFYPILYRINNGFSTPSWLNKSISVLWTFLFLGVFHDMFYTVEDQKMSIEGIKLFLLVAFLILIWEIARKLVKNFYFKFKSSWNETIAIILSRLCFIHVLAGIVIMI